MKRLFFGRGPRRALHVDSRADVDLDVFKETRAPRRRWPRGSTSTFSPTRDQFPASVQSRDEGVCYQWAVEKTGTDPFRLAEKAQAQARASEYNSTAAEGSAVRGAAGGAAAGALIGAIAGSPGTGAAIGAVSGAVINRRRAKKAQEENQASIDAAAQATAGQIANFKKAFSACLESKKYLVKY